MKFLTDALIMVNRMEEVKTVAARSIYVVHHFLVHYSSRVIRNRRLFHVPEVSKSFSKGGRQVYA